MKRINKNRLILGYFVLVFSCITPISLCYEGNIGVDTYADLYRFETDDLTELLDETVDFEHMTVESADSYYKEITDDLVKADKVKTPYKADFDSADFNVENYSLDLYFKEKPKPTGQEIMIMLLWSKNHIYLIALTSNISQYRDLSDLDDIETRDIERTDNMIRLDKVSKTFSDESYVKLIVIYLENIGSDYAVIDLFDNSKSNQLLLIFIIVIIVLVICIVIVILKRKKVL